MHRPICLFALGFTLALTTAPAWSTDVTLQNHPQGIWSMPPTQQENRWLIIHNLTQAKQTGIYHIEVIGRGKHDPVWKIKHLANHIAISEAALNRSIVAPLKKGAVYPESFESAYSQWQKLNNGAGGEVCQTDVVQCLK